MENTSEIEDTSGMENTSGEGPASVIPREVRGLSWGAFWLSWVWGIFNRVWIALAVWIPLVGLVVWFVLLFKGREWAWRNKRWKKRAAKSAHCVPHSRS